MSKRELAAVALLSSIVSLATVVAGAFKMLRVRLSLLLTCLLDLVVAVANLPNWSY
jgi:hypothetical protein